MARISLTPYALDPPAQPAKPTGKFTLSAIDGLIDSPEPTYGEIAAGSVKAGTAQFVGGVGGLLTALSDEQRERQATARDTYKTLAQRERELAEAGNLGMTERLEIANERSKLIAYGRVDEDGNFIPRMDDALKKLEESGRGMTEWAEKRVDEVFREFDLTPHSPKWWTTQAGTAFVRMIPSVALAVATKSPAAASMVFGSDIYGASYNEMKKKGYSNDEARQKATYDALAEVITERLVFARALRPGDDILARAGGTGIAEGAQEVAVEIARIGYETGVLDEEMTPREAAVRLGESMVIGAAVGTTLGLAVHPFSGDAGVDETPTAEQESVLDEVERMRKAREAEPAAPGELPEATPTPTPEPTPAPAPEPAPAAAQEAAPTETGMEGRYDIMSLDVDTLSVDAERFQFRRKTDTAGTEERMKKVEAWNDLQAGVGLVWQDKAGRMFVVDGHHRVALARHLKAQGKPVGKINAFLMREEDGVTQEKARIEGARLNIGQGSGTAYDAAAVFQEDPSILKTLDPQSALVRNAKGISSLTKENLELAEGNDLDAGYAAVIGTAAGKDETLQRGLIDLFVSDPPSSLAEATFIANEFKTNRTADVTTADLFGDELLADSLYKERAKIVVNTVKRLKTSRKLFNSLVVNKSEIEAAGNRLATDNKDLVQDADQILQLIMKQANLAGPISDALNDAAKAMKDGGTLADATTAFVRGLKELAENPAAAPAPVPEPVVEETPEETPQEPEGSPTGDIFLEPYTPEDLAERDREEAELAAEEKAAEQKADADDAADDFTLASENIEPGQEDLVQQSQESELTEETLEKAREDTDTDPTEAQQEAGNYKKGHVKWQGQDIAIENPKGSTRTGTNRDGTTWESLMAHDYGYFNRTEGKDGDQVDVFIGDNLESELVFVVNQVDPDSGKFDEHKVMIGFNSIAEAETGYKANYDKDWQGLGSIHETSAEAFTTWLKDGDTKAPFAEPAEPEAPALELEVQTVEETPESEETAETPGRKQKTSGDIRRREALGGFLPEDPIPEAALAEGETEYLYRQRAARQSRNGEEILMLSEKGEADADFARLGRLAGDAGTRLQEIGEAADTLTDAIWKKIGGRPWIKGAFNRVYFKAGNLNLLWTPGNLTKSAKFYYDRKNKKWWLDTQYVDKLRDVLSREVMELGLAHRDGLTQDPEALQLDAKLVEDITNRYKELAENLGVEDPESDLLDLNLDEIELEAPAVKETPTDNLEPDTPSETAVMEDADAVLADESQEFPEDEVQGGLRPESKAKTALDEQFKAGTAPKLSEETYLVTRPHLQLAYEEAVADGKSVTDFAYDLVAEYGKDMRPFVKRFLSEKQAEARARRDEMQTTEGEAFQPYLPPAWTAETGAPKHPANIVEAASMGAVPAPEVSYRPQIPEAMRPHFSDVQMAAIAAAGQAFQGRTPGGEARGFFIGDGTGLGKAREILGIMLDRKAQGEPRAVLLSKNALLYKQMIDEYATVSGATAEEAAAYIKPLSSDNPAPWGKKTDLDIDHDGVLFITYSSLSLKNQMSSDSQHIPKVGQIIRWLTRNGTEEFDGVIAFDESQQVSNLKFKQDKEPNFSDSSKRALSAHYLQQWMRRAKFVYASATGLSDISQVAYMPRLGLWGEGTAFEDVNDFIGQVGSSGIGAMEMVAQHMKSSGVYMARQISYEDLSYEELTHTLAPAESAAYDNAAKFWGYIYEGVTAAMEALEKVSRNRRAMILGKFYSTQRRFFESLLTAQQMPTAIDYIRGKVDAGESAIVQLVNTQGAALERGAAAVAETEEIDAEMVDMTPQEIATQYISSDFLFAKKTAEDTEALAVPEDVLALIKGLPNGAADQVLGEFGESLVAEITGRTKRIIDGKIKSRAAKDRQTDIEEFMAGNKRVAILSASGGTGINLHNSKDNPKDIKRNHIIVQINPEISGMIQAMGRSHRSNQYSAPNMVFLRTNMVGQTGFVARLLSSLRSFGALSRGDSTASPTMFRVDANLDDAYAEETLRQFTKDVITTSADGFTRSLFEIELRVPNIVQMRDGAETINYSALNMRRFMSRLLQLPGARQDQVFTAYFHRLQAYVEAVKAAGEYEAGIARFEAESATRARDVVIWEKNGNTVNLVELDVTRKVKLNTFSDALARVSGQLAPVVAWGKNRKSGRVYLFMPSTLAKRKGKETEPGLVRIGVTGRALVSRGNITGDHNEVDYYERIVINDGAHDTLTPEQAAKEWAQQYKDADKVKAGKAHFLTGAVMNLFHKLPEHYRPRLYRINLDNGENLVGMTMSENQMKFFLEQGGFEQTTEYNLHSFTGRYGYQATLVLSHHGARLRRDNRGWNLTGAPAWLDTALALKLPGAVINRSEYGEGLTITINDDIRAALQPLFEVNPPVMLKHHHGASFSLAHPAAEGGLDTAAIRRAVGPALSGLTGSGIRVRIVQSQWALPAHIRNEIPAGGLVRGVRLETNEVWLVADNLYSLKQARITLAHEVIGHIGVETVIGDHWEDMVEFLDMLRLSNDKDAHAIFDEVDRRYGHADKDTQAREFMAIAAERRQAGELREGIVMRIFRAIRRFVIDFLRKLGIKGMFTMHDVADILSRAARVNVKDPEYSVYDRQPYFSLEEETETTREAKRKAGLTQDRRSMEARTMALWDSAFNVERHIEGVFDRFYGLKRAQDLVYGAEGLDPRADAYLAARMSLGSSTIFQAVLMYGPLKWGEGQTAGVPVQVEGERGLLEVLHDPYFAEAGIPNENWLGWMVGLRAKRLLAEERERNFTEEDIEALIALGKGHEKDFQRITDEYMRHMKFYLDFAEAGGMINPETRPLWEKYGDYIPFFRAMGDDVLGPKTRKSLSHQRSVRRLQGGMSILNHPLDNILSNVFHLVDAAMKNRAIDLAITNFEAATKSVEVEPGVTVEEDVELVQRVRGYRMAKRPVPLNQVKELLEESGMTQEEIEALPADAMTGFARLWTMEPQQADDVVRVMRKGVPEYYRITDPPLLRALMGVKPEFYTNALMTAARTVKRIKTATITASPSFQARNFIRDSLQAWVVSDSEFRVFVDSFIGLKAIFEKDNPDVIDWMYAGGSFRGGHYNVGGDPRENLHAIRQALVDKGLTEEEIEGALSRVVIGAERSWAVWRAFSDNIENANRLGEYLASARRGDPRIIGAFKSRDLMDFALRGNYAVIHIMADTYEFFNARLQGMYKLGRSGVIPGTGLKRKNVNKALGIALFSIILFLLNKDDERYEETEDWDKDMFWSFLLPFGRVTIPKPFEIGALYATIPERAAAALLGEDKPSKLFERMLWNLTQALGIQPLPTILMPLFELMINRSMFTDRDIHNLADEGLPTELRYSNNTSETAKLISKAFSPLPDSAQPSPKQIEHLVRGYFGVIGLWVMMTLDVGARAATGAPTRPSTDFDRLPLVRSFVKQGPAFWTKYGTRFYEMYREADKLHRAVNKLDREGKDAAVDRMIDKHADQLDELRNLRLAKTELSDIREEMEWIAQSDMTPRVKRYEINELLVLRNKIVKEAVVAAEPYF